MTRSDDWFFVRCPVHIWITRCIARVTLLGTCPSRLLGGGLGPLPGLALELLLLLLLLLQLHLYPLKLLLLLGDERRLVLLLLVPLRPSCLLLLRGDLYGLWV